MKKLIAICVVAGLIFVVGAPAANAGITVEFSDTEEPAASPPTFGNIVLLDGSGLFSAYGLSFADSTYWAYDNRFLPAGTDVYGITTTSGANNLMTVLFTTPVSSVTADWITIFGSDMYAIVYGSAGGVLDAQSVTGLSGTSYGSFTFSGVGDITSISLHDGTSTIGVGRLEFEPVTTAASAPAPGAVVLGSIGAAFVSWLRRRRTL